ncbi:MAG: sulfatase-like hydrolase/transferase [Spirochaetaceae bacterium]|nr:sulfatase-like hydrolase/transferase [Spirochaetaceae bacterium]
MYNIFLSVKNICKKTIEREQNIIVLFLVVLIFSLQVWWIANWPLTFKYIMAIAFSLSVLSSIFSLFKFKVSKSTAILILIWLLSLPVFYIFLKYRNHNPYISNENIKLLTVFLLNIIMLFPFFPRNKKTNKDIAAPNRNMAFLIIFTFLFFLLFYQPLVYYLSAPTDIGISLNSLLLILTIAFIIPFIILLTLFFILQDKGKVLFIRIILLLLISAFVFSMILRINTGMLDAVTFQNEQALFNMPLIKYLLDCFIIAGLWIFTGYLLGKKINIVKLSCPVFIAIMLFTIGERVIRADHKALTVRKSVSAELPDSAFSSHEFSLDGKNIIFMIADMFNGNYFGRILNENEKYSEIFSGFTYYPDCLAISYITASSFPGIFRGHDYIPVRLNNNGKTGIEEIREAASAFFSNIYNAGYQMTVTDPLYFSAAETWGASIEYSRRYINYWKMKRGYDDERESNRAAILFMLSIFNSAPSHWKYIIYDNSAWIILRRSALLRHLRNNAISQLAYIDLLPVISSTNGSRNRFFYIHNELPHSPFGIDSSGNPVRYEFPDNNNISNLNSPRAAYYSARKFINVMANWLNWMKENNVYDNTMIMIFSDHGNSSNDNDIILPEELNNSRVINDISRAQALMLVKGFGATGALRVSPARLSSADIPAILTTETNIHFSSDKDPRQITEERDRIYSSLDDTWNNFLNRDNTRYRSYRVSGSMFDPDSWSIFR